MAMEPGMLNDLHGPGQREWDKFVEQELADAVAESGSAHLVVDGDPDLNDGIVPVDWSGFPVRIRECLGSESNTNALLDWVHRSQPYGRLLGSQEEYLEWRVRRNASDEITRVEMTTETPEFWRVLVKHHPARTLQILGEFAGEPGPAPWRDVYGSNPFEMSLDQREQAFRRMMLPGGSTLGIASPYNNGRKAIAFMAVGPNTLHAAINLAAFAAFPYVKQVGEDLVPLTGREAIRHTRQQAQDCRDSDPTIVGSVIDFAAQGRKIALMDPAGLYVAGVDSDSLLLPDETTPVPPEWFRLTRGSKITTSTGSFSLAQRACLEVPEDMGFVVGDLVDANSGQKIRHGGQIAAKVTVVLYARASRPDVVQSDPNPIEVENTPPCREEPACRNVRNVYEAFERSQGVAEGLALAAGPVRGA